MRNFRVARKMANLTQQDVSTQLGVERSTYSKYESGKVQPDNDKLIEIARILDVSIDFLLDRPNYSETLDDRRLIPVLGEVPAGHPIEAFEQIEEYIDYSPSFAMHGELFALRVKGKSMEPNILSGDIAVVLKQDYCDSGDVAVVRVNDTEVTVKQVKKQANGILLIPRNQSFETVFFTTEQIQQLPVTIIGKVIEIRRRL